VYVLGGEPWQSSTVPNAYQIRGLHGVRLLAARRDPTTRFLMETLGFREAGAYTLAAQEGGPARSVQIFHLGDGGPGTEVHLDVRDDLALGDVGIGGVHHVAFRAPNDTEHRAWRERLVRVVPSVTPVIDRFYFHSIYFREPGGVLFEIATDGPGFAADEDAAHLGERLALPPFLEPHRHEIEAGLRPLDTPASSAAATD
jgi:glyoxalase family protein